MGPWLAGEVDFLDSEYRSVRKAVDRGELVWITVLEENLSGHPPSSDDLRAWSEELYDHPLILALRGDKEHSVMTATGGYAAPTAFVLRAGTMRVIAKGGTYDLLDDIQDLLDAQDPE